MPSSAELDHVSVLPRKRGAEERSQPLIQIQKQKVVRPVALAMTAENAALLDDMAVFAHRAKLATARLLASTPDIPHHGAGGLLGRPDKGLAPIVIGNAEVQVQRGAGVSRIVVESAGAPTMHHLVVVDGDVGTCVGVVAGALQGGVESGPGRGAQARNRYGSDGGKGEEPVQGQVDNHDVQGERVGEGFFRTGWWEVMGWV